jgi:hypothetical protein
MSKEEHDARGPVQRAATRHADRPWYRSAERVRERHRLHGLACLDLCAGNAESSAILREHFAMRVTCADYAPAHLERQRALGFDVLRADLDGATADVDDPRPPGAHPRRPGRVAALQRLSRAPARSATPRLGHRRTDGARTEGRYDRPRLPAPPGPGRARRAAGPPGAR